jgi:hypothetical protein
MRDGGKPTHTPAGSVGRRSGDGGSGRGSRGATGVASGEKTASDTINELQSQGYTVTIDRIGTGPMSDCVVRNHSRFRSGCRSSARYWAAVIGTF